MKYPVLLSVIYLIPVAHAGPSRTATGGSTVQSVKSAVELRLRNEMEVINERVRSTDQHISTQAKKIENIIRQIDNLEPVIVKTRVRTVTRRHKNDRDDRDDRDRGFGGGRSGDGGGCGSGGGGSGGF